MSRIGIKSDRLRVVIVYARTLKTPVTYRLYGEQNSVYNNSEFKSLCDKCIYIDVY